MNAAPLDAAAMMAVFERVAPMIFGGLAVLVRIAVLFSVIPELGTGYAPRRVRLVLFASMATVVSFGLGLPALPVDTSVVQVFVTIMREVLLGAALGLAVRLVLSTVQMAGDLAGTSMGLSLATFFDRTAGENPLATGRLFVLIASLAFLAMDGHRIFMLALMEHFILFPVGSLSLELPTPEIIAESLSQTFAAAVVLAAPVIVVAFLFNLAKGLVMRMVPEFNLFNIGVVLLLLGGFLSLGLAGDAIMSFLSESLEALPLRMQDLAGGRRG